MNAVVWVLVGMATVYAGPYVGQPLYCDAGEGLRYQASTPNWVALDVGLYESGWARCGDLVELRFGDGTRMLARAWDAGPLAGYGVRVGEELVPIVVDVPADRAPFVGLSCRVRVMNWSRYARERFRR